MHCVQTEKLHWVNDLINTYFAKFIDTLPPLSAHSASVGVGGDKIKYLGQV